MSNSPDMISARASSMASSQKGMTQPPRVKSPLGSSSGPPGDCMIPSSATWVMAMIFLMGLSPFGPVLLGVLDFLRSEQQLQISDKVIDTFDRDLRPALRFGENEGALENGLDVEREGFGGPCGRHRPSP